MGKSKLFILVVSLCLILILSFLAACSSSTTSAPPATTAATTAAKTTAPASSAPATTAATTTAASGKTEILLGAVNSLTGVNVLTAQEQKWGQEQAVADINAKGGVNVGGKMMKLKLVFEDDASTPEGGAAAMEKLIKVDKVDLALSTNITPINEAAGNVAEKYGMYYAINTSWVNTIADHKWKWVSDLFTSTSSASEGPFQIWALQPAAERPTKIAVMMEDNPDGQGFGQGFIDNAKKYNYNIVDNDAYTPGAKDYSSNILKMKSTGADALLWLGSPPDGITLIQQIKAQNLNLKYIHGWKGFWDIQFPTTLGKDANYIMHDGFWVESLPYPGAADLGKKFRDAHNGQDSVSVGLPYASVQIVAMAIEKAGSYDSAKVRDAVFNGTFKGTVMGDVTFNWNGNPGIGFSPLLGLQWMNGKRIVIWPDVGNKLQWIPPWDKRP